MKYTSRFSLFVFLAGAVLLSGCTTEEVKKEVLPKEGLSFDKGKTETPTSPAGQATKEKNVPPTVPPESKPITNPTNPVSTKKMYTTKPEMTIDITKAYSATLKTSAGDIVIALDAKNAPMTVNNFVFLTKEKFYDDTIFHRTIKGFMIQGGDPTGTGMGGPGYKFADEPFTGEYTRGTVAMANAGPNTNGSQFFIMHKDNPLPKNYVIFGTVTAGMEVVDKIAEAPTKSGGEGSSPLTPVSIQTAIISEK